MSIVRRRYYFWLIRAYISRWSKTILTSLAIGVAVFFLIFFVFSFYFLPSLQKKVQKIGYAGTYTAVTLPQSVLSDISYGLTKVDSDGSVKPAAAYKWDIKDNGKSYVFYIKKGQYFNSNDELTSKTLNLSFKDVEKKIIDEYTVEFVLHEPYSPFLATAARPIFSSRFAGLGDYKVQKADINGGFVRSITLQSKKDSKIKKIIKFYPTQEALKVAYALGEVDQVVGVSDPTISASILSSWSNTTASPEIDYGKLVSLFYNNTDSDLSDKNLRQALNYSIPSEFEEGERAYSSIPPNSVYFAKGPNYGITDLEIAKSLIEDREGLDKKVFEISTPKEFENVAERIVESWKKIGVNAKVEVVDSFLPRDFQILIYPISLPQDPDQYTLWHSNGVNNIINYKKNARIDKLLEDGRATNDFETRASIYADFQKYLVDDVPASFLYFPYTYKISRN